MDDLKLEINNFGPINNVKLDIGKINVVGGVNGSGKSTVSKLLYCYLKSEIDDESLDYLMDSEDLSDLKVDEIIFKTDFTPSDIFYIDNLSILDLKDLDILRVDHIVHIKEALEDDTTQNSSDILPKIHDITKWDCKNSQFSSGIKEIGIIQLLLQNAKLKEDSFLIIDEPESSLHPEWEIKYAEVLILLVKELNVHYILTLTVPCLLRQCHFIHNIMIY